MKISTHGNPYKSVHTTQKSVQILRRYIHTTYTGWCILSRTTAIPHMVRQADAPEYFLRVILLIWNILTRITKVTSMNKLGKICDVM